MAYSRGKALMVGSHLVALVTTVIMTAREPADSDWGIPFLFVCWMLAILTALMIADLTKPKE